MQNMNHDESSWLKHRRTLAASFTKRVHRKPTADELQELCLALHVRRSQTTDDNFALAFWRAVHDVVDIAIRRSNRHEREQNAIQAHDQLRRSNVGLIPTFDRYRTDQETAALERVQAFVPVCIKIDRIVTENES